MSWVWFDVCQAPTTESVLASAPVWTEDGRTAGVLCAWAGDREQPTPTASKLDARAVDASGEGG